MKYYFFIPLKVYFYQFLLYSYLKGYKNLTTSISDFIKQKRKQLKLTQPDLAERAGVGLRFVRELEQGKQTVRLDKVNQVLALFGSKLGVIRNIES